MKFFSNTKLVISSLFIITLIAYFQTLWMYFWIDDNALIYKLQHLNTYSGYWGAGAFGGGPYRHIIDQFVPFYPLFKTNPTPYYAVGILLYFLAGVTIYFIVRTLSRNKFLAWASAAIFASGFVGSESIFGITNSWQTSRGIIMAVFTLWLFYKYIKTWDIKFYIFSLILFFFSIDTVYVRAHGFIFCVIFFDLIFTPVLLGKKSIIAFLVRQVPFVFVYYYVYLTSTAMVRSFGFFNFIEDVFSEKKYILLSVPLQNIGNLFIPDAITKLIDNFVIRNIRSFPPGFSLGSTLAGFAFLSLLAYLVLKWRKKEPLVTKILIFSAVWMLANMMVYVVRETALVLQTTHRYLTYSFVGLAVFWATSLYLLAKQFNLKKSTRLFIIITSLILGIYLYLGTSFQHRFNETRSIPARNFFESFDKFIPNIPKGAVIYFNIENNPEVRGKYNQFFGGMFSEAGNLAILSDTVQDYTNDFLVTYDFNEVTQMLRENKVSLDNVFSFYYGDSGLVDTTAKFRQLITQKQVVNVPQDNISIDVPTANSIENNPSVTINAPEDSPSMVASNLNFSMSVATFLPRLPYSTGGQDVSIQPEEKRKIFSYLSARRDFITNATASSASFWRDQTPGLAIDGRTDTSWRGHRGFWEEIFRGRSKEVEFLSVDLKSVKSISQIRWVPGFYQLVPTEYKILTSADSKKWDVALQVNKSEYLPTETVIVDSFNPVDARYVKMEINKTYGNDGPEIKEFEVVESLFTGLDRVKINQLETQPFTNVLNINEFNDATRFVLNNPKLRFYWMSDADKTQDPTKYVQTPIKIDGKVHEYSIPLPAEGINWIKFNVRGLNFPAQISVKSVRIDYNSVSETKR